MVWVVSRFGRPLQHLVAVLKYLTSINCNHYIYQSGFDI